MKKERIDYMVLKRKKRINQRKLRRKGIIGLGLLILLLFSSLLLSAYSSNDNNKKNHHNDSKNSKNGKNSNTAFKIVIDPGHGGKDVGAPGESGKYEKDFTLSVSKRLEKLLKQEPGIQVFMTRADDSFISQESRYRPKYANKLNADLFISIHANTFINPDVSGTETFYYHENSRLFAKILQKHVAKATEFRDRGIMKKDLFVARDTEMPAALIEVGYLTNPQEETIMWTDDFQNRVAASIVEGIKEYQVKSEKRGFEK